MAKALSFWKFYPRDWMADEKLQLCSLAARGLWLHMLCLMHANTRRRGYLEHPDGSPLTPEQLGRSAGTGPEQVVALLAELGAAGVFSRDDDRVIYSRRMVDDTAFLLACSAAGRKGGGNPTFKGSPKGSPKGTPKGSPKVPPKPSDINTEEEIQKDTPLNPPVAAAPTIPPQLDTPEFRAAWSEWLTARREQRKPVTDRAARAQLAALAAIGSNAAIACIRDSIRNGWQGLFPEKFGTRSAGSGPGLFDHAAKAEARILAQAAEANAPPNRIG